MFWVVALFVTMGAVGGTTGGQSQYKANSTFLCDTDKVYAPEQRTLQLGSFRCIAQPTFTPTPSPRAVFSPTPPPGATPTPATPVSGIWTSAENLYGKSESCPAFTVLLVEAQKDTASPCIHNPEDPTPNRVLAKAIAYAKTGNPAYRQQVEQTLNTLVSMGYTGCNGNPAYEGGKKITLSWARNLAGYVMAADLIGYQSAAFNTYLTDVSQNWVGEETYATGPKTMKQMFEARQDSWSKWAAASLSAVYRYLGNNAEMANLRQHLLAKLYGPVPATVTEYGQTDWYLASPAVVPDIPEIMPVGAAKTCPQNLGQVPLFQVDLNGLQPQEMKIGGACAFNPVYTNSPWDGIEGLVVAGRIFERAGIPIWQEGNKGLMRAGGALEERLGAQSDVWQASNDEAWALVFLDAAYGSRWAARITNDVQKWGGSPRSGGYGYVLPGVCGTAIPNTPTPSPTVTPTIDPLATPTTTPIAGAGVKFAVIGDYGTDSTAEGRVATLVDSWNPDFVITTGDNNYPDGEASTIDVNIGKYYRKYIGNYTGSFGAGSATPRFYPSLGNHDWHTITCSGSNCTGAYFNYFTLPGNERYYDVDKGLVHLFSIDSDSGEPDGTSATSAQGTWLQNALTASTSCYNVVYFHHPPYSSGKHGPSSRMQWPFASWGADVVFNGHDHLYERLSANGIPYMVVGAGGASLYSFDNISNNGGAQSQFRHNADWGALLVTATKAEIRYQYFDAAGTKLDDYAVAGNCP